MRIKTPWRASSAIMNSAWSKLLVVVACTLADSMPEGLYPWHHLNVFAHALSNTTVPVHNASCGGLSNISSVCSAPCSTLGARLRPRHLVTPASYLSARGQPPPCLRSSSAAGIRCGGSQLPMAAGDALVRTGHILRPLHARQGVGLCVDAALLYSGPDGVVPLSEFSCFSGSSFPSVRWGPWLSASLHGARGPPPASFAGTLARRANVGGPLTSARS